MERLQVAYLSDASNLVARSLIAFFYLAAGFGLIQAPGTLSMQEGVELPVVLSFADMAFQVLAASCILIGFQTRLAAALLALYVFWSSFIFNFHPGQPYAMGLFWKDLVVVGGLLIVLSNGEGRFGLDAWVARRSAREPDADTPAPAGTARPSHGAGEPVASMGFAPVALRASRTSASS